MLLSPGASHAFAEILELSCLCNLCNDTEVKGGHLDIPQIVDSIKINFERKSSLQGHVLTLLGLCEEILKKLPSTKNSKYDESVLASARAEFAELYRLNEDKKESETPSKCQNQRPDFYTTMGILDHPVSSYENSILDICNSLNPSGTASRVSISRTHNSPIKFLFDTLKFRRVITLNYDVQLERYLASRLTDSRLKSHKPFQTLCSKSTAYPSSSSVEVIDGTRRYASSITITPKKIGSLINFSAYSRAFDYQICHLHGRLDDPKNLVITENDYQRIYLQDREASRLFDESREILFGGNDILMIGIGLNEEDVLRPFRQFVSDHAPQTLNNHRLIAFMPRFAETKGDLSSRVKAITNYHNYGIYTVYYGEDQTLEVLGLLKAAEERIQKGSTKRLFKNLTSNKLVRNILRIEEIQQLSDLQFKAINILKTKPRLLLLVEIIRNRIVSEALLKEMKKIDVEYKNWFSDWAETAGERRAKNHNIKLAHHKGNANAHNDYIQSRHFPHYSNTSSLWNSKRSKEYLNISTVACLIKEANCQRNINDNVVEKSKNGFILRFALGRGQGKGTLLHLLHSKAVHDKLRKGGYSAVYITHLSFSLEFSSIIKALTRFFAKRIGILKFNKDTKLIEKCIEEPRELLSDQSINNPMLPNRVHRIHLLFYIMQEYIVETRKHPLEHVLIVVSGLDKICDTNGDAYNPAHRMLFRLLVGKPFVANSEALKPPMDLILINGRPNIPTNYLSEKQLDTHSSSEIIDSQDQNLSKRSATGRVNKKWAELPSLSWPERCYFILGNENYLPKTIKDLELLSKHYAEDLNVRVNRSHSLMPLLSLLSWPKRQLSNDNSMRLRCGRNLHLLLHNDTAIFILVLKQWLEIAPRMRDKTHLNKELDNYFSELDYYASTESHRGVVNGVLRKYKEYDSEQTNISDFDFNSKSELQALIVRHLALFTLPVEPTVLRVCPLIAALLESQAAHDNVEIHNREHHILTLLKEIMDLMWSRGLIIRINPPVDSTDSNTTTDTSADGQQQQAECFHFRYSVHIRLREYLAKSMRLTVLDEGERNLFQVSLYTDQPKDLPTPSVDHYKMVKGILDSLLEYIDLRVDLAYLIKNSIDNGSNSTDSFNVDFAVLEEKGHYLLPAVANMLYRPDIENGSNMQDGMLEMHTVSQALRAAYSLIRGTFSLGTLTRFSNLPEHNSLQRPLETYRSWLRSLHQHAIALNKVSNIATALLKQELLPVGAEKRNGSPITAYEKDMASNRPQIWSRWLKIETSILAARPKTSTKRQSTSPPYDSLRQAYYRDELAWIFNERGLTALLQGRIYDSLPLFERATRLMSHWEAGKENLHEFHSSERRIQLNYAYALIERGQLEQARGILVEIRLTSKRIKWHTPTKSEAVAIGYLALCDHLNGSFENAEKGYLEAIRKMTRFGRDRGVAIFYRHLGNLYRAEGSYAKAEKYLNFAVNKAAQCEQRDVLHWALTSQAELYIFDGRNNEATAIIRRVSSYASKMGLYSLEAAILLVESQMMLRLGELDLSGNFASKAISNSVRNGGRLRKLSGLVTYADILVHRGEFELASSILDEAKTEAEKCGYNTQGARAAKIQSTIVVRP